MFVNIQIHNHNQAKSCTRHNAGVVHTDKFCTSLNRCTCQLLPGVRLINALLHCCCTHFAVYNASVWKPHNYRSYCYNDFGFNINIQFMIVFTIYSQIRSTYNQVRLVTGNLLVGHVCTVHVWVVFKLKTALKRCIIK